MPPVPPPSPSQRSLHCCRCFIDLCFFPTLKPSTSATAPAARVLQYFAASMHVPTKSRINTSELVGDRFRLNNVVSTLLLPSLPFCLSVLSVCFACGGCLSSGSRQHYRRCLLLSATAHTPLARSCVAFSPWNGFWHRHHNSCSRALINSFGTSVHRHSAAARIHVIQKHVTQTNTHCNSQTYFTARKLVTQIHTITRRHHRRCSSSSMWRASCGRACHCSRG